MMAFSPDIFGADALACEIIRQTSAQHQEDHQYLSALLKRLKPEFSCDKVEKVSRHKHVFFFLGSCAGLIYAFFDGLDGIVSILQLLHLNNLLNLFFITCFTALSLLVFTGFDIAETAANLGIDWGRKKMSHFDVIVEQKKKLHKIALMLDKEILQTSNPKKLAELEQEISRLIEINKRLNVEIEHTDKAINSTPTVLMYRYAAVILCALLFMSFGFFTGQAGILFLLGDLTLQQAMAQLLTATLTIGGSLVSALGCTFFYWMVQRPGVDNLICNSLFGVDLEQLEALESDEMQTELSEKLADKKSLAIQKKGLLNSATHSPLVSHSLFKAPVTSSQADDFDCISSDWVCSN